MAKVFIEESSLSAIGSAIRGKTGKTALLPVLDMPGEITGIQTGVDTGDATATAADIRKSKTAYAKGAKITGTLPDATQATPSITVSTGGLITASATQTAGYVAAGTKSATKQLSVQAAKTVTPSASEQTAVASGKYTTGAITVAAIPSSYAQLNFSVVGGTSQPSSPAENTIWVNTSTAISEWIFSTEQPTNPVAGMVWFQTGTGSGTAFNALKKNNITVYPTGCQQYISGAWIDKTAKTYQGGAWVDWWKGELYENGNEFESVTGGWVVKSLAVDGGASAGQGAITRNADHIVFVGQSAVMHCANKIDLTNFKKITLTGTLNGVAGEPTWCNFRIWSEFGNTQADNIVAKVDSNGTTTNPSIDISSLQGEYIVGFGCHGSKSVTMYKLIME